MLPAITHWSRVTHICVGNLTIIVANNGLSPGRRQAIIWTNAGILLIEPLGTSLSEILIEILPFSFKKMRLKVSSATWRPSCLDLNVMMCHQWAGTIPIPTWLWNMTFLNWLNITFPVFKKVKFKLIGNYPPARRINNVSPEHLVRIQLTASPVPRPTNCSCSAVWRCLVAALYGTVCVVNTSGASTTSGCTCVPRQHNGKGYVRYCTKAFIYGLVKW